MENHQISSLSIFPIDPTIIDESGLNDPDLLKTSNVIDDNFLITLLFILIFTLLASFLILMGIHITRHIK